MEKIVVWGTMKNPEGLLEKLEHGYEILGWIDSKKEYQHKNVRGYYVFSPEELLKIPFDKIVLGTASCFGNRAIIKMCHSLGISDEKIVTKYTMRTEQMKICDIFSLQYAKGEERSFYSFARMNLLIQYAFIEQYYGKSKLGYALAEKYVKSAYQGEEAKDHFERFVSLIESVEQEGIHKETYVSLNRNGYLIDGTHRLACMLYRQCEDAEVDIFHSDWELENGGARTLKWLENHLILTEEEKKLLIRIYEKLCKQLKIEGKTGIKKDVNIWEQEIIQ